MGDYADHNGVGRNMTPAQVDRFVEQREARDAREGPRPLGSKPYQGDIDRLVACAATGADELAARLERCRINVAKLKDIARTEQRDDLWLALCDVSADLSFAIGYVGGMRRHNRATGHKVIVEETRFIEYAAQADARKAKETAR